jgi:hypothetical protein
MWARTARERILANSRLTSPRHGVNITGKFMPLRTIRGTWSRKLSSDAESERGA